MDSYTTRIEMDRCITGYYRDDLYTDYPADETELWEWFEETVSQEEREECIEDFRVDMEGFRAEWEAGH